MNAGLVLHEWEGESQVPASGLHVVAPGSVCVEGSKAPHMYNTH